MVGKWFLVEAADWKSISINKCLGGPVYLRCKFEGVIQRYCNKWVCQYSVVRKLILVKNLCNLNCLILKLSYHWLDKHKVFPLCEQACGSSDDLIWWTIYSSLHNCTQTAFHRCVSACVSSVCKHLWMTNHTPMIKRTKHYETYYIKNDSALDTGIYMYHNLNI